MRQLTIIIACILFASTQLIGQAVTNKAALNEFSLQKAFEFQARKAEAISFATQNKLPVLIDNNGVLMELMYIDDLGQPQYYITNNVNSSATISTNKVNSGGGFGYSLDGNGMTLHEWDGGAVLSTHQEYAGRVMMGDGVTTTHYHSTHVAGTLIASGVNGDAKGMAPAAELRAFDWNNDESEMASEAANNNALVSNHSYGYGRGWVYSGASWSWYGNPSISTQEDYLFGFYDSQAQTWDGIAANAPYYLICKSAGNDRGDGPANPPYPLDGPYDCISHAALGKNILTVGAVEDIPGGYSGPSSVLMSYFSSWGPADDGRIKPDIVTNGVSLYSTDNGSNTDYTSLSGTSMASPSAAGSAILLQEHYESLHGTGNFMLASTLKAVIIHTADEAGSYDGPDYSFGWGLMNTLAAADVISDDASLNSIEEITLNNGGTYQRTVTADGSQPLKVTIAWTDLPGNPVSASLDPSDPMIINELDLRVTQASNTFFPWKLDINNPAAAATRNGENNVDNVEVVTIDNPAAGTDYTIVVDHDGSLSGGSQVFSLVVSGIGTGTPMPPVADFSADNTNPLTGGTVVFTDLSTNAPTGWAWSFNPSTVTFVNGTNASSQYPEVTFDVAGHYDVTLMATNAYGSDDEVKTAYVNVTDPQPFSLPWTEDFEGAVTTIYTANEASLNGLPVWSYDKTVDGRLRLAAGSGYYLSGNHAATLDAYPAGLNSVNYLTATLDLSAYAASTNLELSFNYMHHGEESHSNDRVWIRGSNADPWIEIYDLYTNRGNAGVWKYVNQFDIDDLLNTAGQSPTSTFQLRFGQEDNYPATSTTASDGFTFDDITVKEIDQSAYIISTFPYSQSWEDGIGLWSQSETDDFDWTRNSGGTPSSSTGPLGAHDGDWYMYTESSSPRVNGDEAHLEAIFNFSSVQSPVLTFYYHMFGISIASLNVDIFDGSWNNNVWSATGPQQAAQGDPYEQAVVDLSAWGGQNNIVIRFRGIVGNGAGSTYYSDMAIDLIEVTGDYQPSPPVADFWADHTDVAVGGNVQFNDISTNNPSNWSWTFEGGNPAGSTLQNPAVTYDAVGTYTVSLTASNDLGSDTETKTGYITVHASPVAEFTVTEATIKEGETAYFTDLSTGDPVSWSWTYEGGTPSGSNDQHPAIVYHTEGMYTVSLEASNPYGSDIETKTAYITVLHVETPPVAEFTVNNTIPIENESVTFTDLSINDPTSWSWTFEGATPSTSTYQHPEVYYPIAGVYTVELTVTNADGTDTETKVDYITVSGPPSTTQLSFTDFESGWGIWTDGGRDCELYTGGTYAWSGNNAANIQDNSDILSSFYMTDGQDVHTPGYTVIKVEFYFVAVSMDNYTEDFWVQYYDGSTWQTVASYAYGVDFENNIFYYASVYIDETNYNFPDNMKIRFMCDAGSNNDDIYIDDILITATGDPGGNSDLVNVGEIKFPLSDAFEPEETEIKVYPNPVQDQLHIEVPGADEAEIYIFSVTGQLMYQGRSGNLQESINVSDLEKGLYFVKVILDGEILTTKLIKQ